ncbi:MAG: hypothetical protein U1E64_01525 [Sphingomonadaceae bacterium]
MVRSLLLAFCILVFPGCRSLAASDTLAPISTSPDEKTERDAILGKVQAAIAASDFAALNGMEEEFRSSRARMPSGLWKLAVFHAGLQFYLAKGLERQFDCQYRTAEFIAKWAAAAPDNPAPVITDAAMLDKQAWCFRGGGYADHVAQGDWPKFRKGVAAAFGTLEQHSATASADPEYYAVKLGVLRDMSASPEAFHTFLDEAVAREPDYHRTYFMAVWSYLPQWGGSYAAVEQFARYAADQTSGSEQDGLYARIFWSLEECGCEIVKVAADWPRMKQAMRDVYNLYPVASNSEYFTDLACRMGDVEEGRRYLRAAHPEFTDDASFAPMFTYCDSRAQMGK